MNGSALSWSGTIFSFRLEGDRNMGEFWDEDLKFPEAKVSASFKLQPESAPSDRQEFEFQVTEMNCSWLTDRRKLWAFFSKSCVQGKAITA